MNSLIFLLLISFISPNVFAETLPSKEEICNQADVRTFSVHLDSSRELLYHYRYLKSESKDAPLVIYIPGGPGSTTIGNTDRRQSKNYSLILTDPRGSGCNDSEVLLASDINSEKIADDIVSLIENLKPQKYIIHGQSFGSVVATILSTKLFKKNILQPSAIILEGVFGKYWDQRSEKLGLVDAWSKIFPLFSKSLREKLAANEENPFGLSSDQWLATVYQTTYLGLPAFLPYSTDQLLEIFVEKRKGTPLPSDLAPLVTAVDYGSLPFGEKTRNAIACNELFYADEGFDMTYSFGTLHYSVTSACEKSAPRPFDSEKWQMKHKTYYFIG